MTDTLAATPLHDWHVKHGARMAEFAGYSMPIQYSTIVAEHHATRRAATVFDISHMGRLRLEGPRADQLLDRIVTRRVLDMVAGQIRYGLVCDAKGGILDDVLVYCMTTPSDHPYFLMVVNAGNRRKIVAWLEQHRSDFPDVILRDTTDDTAMIAVQGPRAVNTIRKILPLRCAALGYYRGCVTDQMSKPVIVSRTGYTGEDGFELVVRREDAVRVWENLLLAGRDAGLVPAGLGARDTLRLEAGMPLYGHELSEQVDPIQAGLEFAVQLKDRSFVGHQAIARSQAQPPELGRVGLVLEGRRAARQGADLVDTDGRVVGSVTSGSFSPTLDRPIAMGYVARSIGKVGLHLEVDIRGSRAAAQVVGLPFYKRPPVSN